MKETPNLKYINEMADGDTSFREKLIDIIKKEFPIEKDTYFTNLKSNNRKLTIESIHKIKHKISILGLEKSYSIAELYEENMRNGKSNYKIEFEEVLNTISDFLIKLK